MPQMAPINWLSLFFLFSLTFIIFNVMNYFSFEIKKYKLTMNPVNNATNSYLTWKW